MLWLDMYASVAVTETSEDAPKKIQRRTSMSHHPSTEYASKASEAHTSFIVGPFMISKTWKQTELVNLCIDKENGAHIDSGLLFSLKKKKE